MCYVVERQKHMCIDFYYGRQYAGVIMVLLPFSPYPSKEL